MAAMQTEKASRMLIVDGHAYAYRSFHAIRSLSSPSGIPTNAIYGFIKAIEKMRALLEPSHIVVIWDGGLAPHRMQELPEYKAQRAPMPDTLGPQIEGLAGWLPAAGFATLCHEGVEADDWIAATARQASAHMPVVIASADKDFMQLVSADIGLLNPNDKSEKVWTAAEVTAKTGVRPDQIVDWLSLIGDAVDNIPGVPGVGPKTATDLLTRFGTVESLYEHLAEVKSDRVRTNLQGAAEEVRRNQRLVRLLEDQPPPPLAETGIKEPNLVRLRALYAEWGFRTLLAQAGGAPVPPPAQGELL